MTTHYTGLTSLTPNDARKIAENRAKFSPVRRPDLAPVVEAPKPTEAELDAFFAELLAAELAAG